MRRLQARSEATSPQATQWVEEHAKFLKGHPKMRSSVAKVRGRPEPSRKSPNPDPNLNPSPSPNLEL